MIRYISKEKQMKMVAQKRVAKENKIVIIMKYVSWT